MSWGDVLSCLPENPCRIVQDREWRIKVHFPCGPHIDDQVDPLRFQHGQMFAVGSFKNPYSDLRRQVSLLLRADLQRDESAFLRGTGHGSRLADGRR